MNKILLVGFVCISLGAFAQSSADRGQTPSSKTTTAAAPQDAATGQTSGKRMHKPIEMQKEASAGAQANGSNNGQPSTHVATGDVNGDGRADLTATKSSGSATSPRDAASGQPTGKRQHQPVTVRKEVDTATPKLK
jgi:hypothetical protein